MNTQNIDTQHADMVDELVKPGSQILASMTGPKMHLLHMASKLNSEAGELMDAIGKHCYYNKELDVTNVIEELGDIEFYMEGVRSEVGISRSDVLQGNMDKLRKRYSQGYSDKAAQERADKQ